MKKKIIFTILLHLSFLMILTGCNHETVGTEVTIVTTIDDVDINQNGPIKRDTVLRVATLDATNYTYDDWTQHFDRWVRKFEAAYRNVDVVIENMLGTECLQTELMAGKGPDIILSPTYAEWDNLNFSDPNCPIPISDVNQACAMVFSTTSANFTTQTQN